MGRLAAALWAVLSFEPFLGLRILMCMVSDKLANAASSITEAPVGHVHKGTHLLKPMGAEECYGSNGASTFKIFERPQNRLL
jgi:hypothetical protein